jgi:hypothetical protein
LNPHRNRLARIASLRHAAYALFVCLTLSLLAEHAGAQSLPVNTRALRFVTDLVLNDFHTAQAGGGYVFSYDREDTDDTLTASLARWFSGKDTQAIVMEPSEKRALFGFYWAASMMPATSPCFSAMFSAMVNDACQDDLARWMAREADDDPRFVQAYEAARKPLGLPPLMAPGH